MSKAFQLPRLAPSSSVQPRFKVATFRPAIAPCLAGAVASAIWSLPQDLEAGARVARIVTVLSVIGWTLTKIPESLVALGAAMALVLTGTVGEDRLFATLGSDLVWLLLAAFIIAVAIKDARADHASTSSRCRIAVRLAFPIPSSHWARRSFGGPPARSPPAPPMARGAKTAPLPSLAAIRAAVTAAAIRSPFCPRPARLHM